MIVIYNSKPFDHIIIKDFFSAREYTEVFEELVFLKTRMRGPESTGASFNKENEKEMSKRGVGIFLDSIYKDTNEQSSIGRCSSIKIFGDQEIQDRVQKAKTNNYYFRHWNPEKLKTSMIAQYYDDGDFYRSHFDDALFSVVTTLYQTPREFSGGRFVFPEFDYWLDLEDNMSVIFPSVLIHEVEPVTIKKSGELLGRFSVTSFITHK